MDSLNKELIYKIFLFVLYPRGYNAPAEKGNGRLACISRAWQAVVEPITFSRITLTQHDLLVDFPPITPDGRWLCKRPDGKNADQIVWEEWNITDPDGPGSVDPDPNRLDHPAYTNMHRFRMVPIRELLNPLLKGLARTMSKVPAMSDVDWSLAGEPGNRIEFITNFDDGGGDLAFYGFGFYENGEDLIDTGEPLVDEEVVEYFKGLLSAREPKGEIEITIE